MEVTWTRQIFCTALTPTRFVRTAPNEAAKKTAMSAAADSFRRGAVFNTAYALADTAAASQADRSSVSSSAGMMTRIAIPLAIRSRRLLADDHPSKETMA